VQIARRVGVHSKGASRHVAKYELAARVRDRQETFEAYDACAAESHAYPDDRSRDRLPGRRVDDATEDDAGAPGQRLNGGELREGRD
jgi:hypothetical protein